MATTGLAPGLDPKTLPTGILSYNGVTFNALYKSSISGQCVQDEAKRTIKYLQYTLDVEGIVTLEANQPTTDVTWTALRKQLSQQGAQLTYSGKGFGAFTINPQGQAAGVALRDVAWGPTPKVLEFRPLGGSRAAFIKWTCEVHLPEVTQMQNILKTRGDAGLVLQFNWEHELSYDEEGYASYAIRGTLEIPLTRTVAQSRSVTSTVDAFRHRWLDLQTDLTKFRVVRRHFGYSRDKRTVEWEFACEELPPMKLPAGITKATGTFSVRPAGATPFGGKGGGAKLLFTFWTCSLRATYTVRSDKDRRIVFDAFYALLWFRMQASKNGVVPSLASPQQPPPPNPQQASSALSKLAAFAGGVGGKLALGLGGVRAQQIYSAIFQNVKPPAPQTTRATWLTDFGFDEGLYLDSKTITIHASWWLTTTFNTILQACGTFRQVEGNAAANLWSASMKDIMGWRSVRDARLDPTTDFIVDFGDTGRAPVDRPFISSE